MICQVADVGVPLWSVAWRMCTLKLPVDPTTTLTLAEQVVPPAGTVHLSVESVAVPLPLTPVKVRMMNSSVVAGWLVEVVTLIAERVTPEATRVLALIVLALEVEEVSTGKGLGAP